MVYKLKKSDIKDEYQNYRLARRGEKITGVPTIRIRIIGKNKDGSQRYRYVLVWREINGEIRIVSAHKKRKLKQIIRKRQPRSRERMFKLQVNEKDWAHLSDNYNNILGLTDEEIDKWIEHEIKYKLDHTYYETEQEKKKKEKEYREKTEKYIRNIKCYNSQDIKEISKNMHMKLLKKCGYEDLWNNKELLSDTIFLTSPRGGFEILSDYAYSNGLGKRNMPYDLKKGVKTGDYGKVITLESTSLPYNSKIKDVNNIVYIDDICMSGEQQANALIELNKMIDYYHVHKTEIPKLHYMAVVGHEDILEKESKDDYTIDFASPTDKRWDSIIIGDIVDVKSLSSTNFDEKEDCSAIVFPYSIPDGVRHRKARKLYRYSNKLFG